MRYSTWYLFKCETILQIKKFVFIWNSGITGRYFLKPGCFRVTGIGFENRENPGQTGAYGSPGTDRYTRDWQIHNTWDWQIHTGLTYTHGTLRYTRDLQIYMGLTNAHETDIYMGLTYIHGTDIYTWDWHIYMGLTHINGTDRYTRDWYIHIGLTNTHRTHIYL